MIYNFWLTCTVCIYGMGTFEVARNGSNISLGLEFTSQLFRSGLCCKKCIA